MAKVTESYNLKAVNPLLTKEWHPVKNGRLTPRAVSPNSGKKVWWLCAKGHEWSASIDNRAKGKGCPFCSNKAVHLDNCLATVKPSLAKEWHPTKNGNLTPKDVTPGTDRKVWWVCIKGHNWQASIDHRTTGSGCPFCCGRVVTPETCLSAVKPNLVKEWHPVRNGSLTPADVSAFSNKTAWWLCAKGHEWQANISNRANGAGCSFCANRSINSENCFATINPTLAEEWHPTRNKELTSQNVSPYSSMKVWWTCAKGHEWQASIGNRAKGRGCPFCSNRSVNSENCLATAIPGLSKEWHPIRNGKITPKDVTPGSNKKAWWLCAKGHEWSAIISGRAGGGGCPFCCNRSINSENCLATTSPDLAKEWHPIRNAKLTPNDVAPNAGRKVWWLCAKGHEWQASIDSRAKGSGCPSCSPHTSRMELRIYSEIKFLFKDACLQKKMYGMECDIYIPALKLAIEVDGSYWHRDKQDKDLNKTRVLQENGITVLRVREKGLDRISEHDVIHAKKTEDVAVLKEVLNSISKVTVLGVSHKALIEKYIKESKLKNNEEFVKLYSLLPTALPGESLMELKSNVAKEWHPTRNGSLTPKDVTPGSGIKIWWLCAKGHEWQANIASRAKGMGCPFCSNKAINSENCLEAMNPALASEWHPTKNSKLTAKDVAPKSSKRVWWLCVKGHTWQAPIYNRANGNGCPFCANKSVNSENCLATVSPDLAKEWHPVKNSYLTPKDVTRSSGKKAWWLCIKGHAWYASVDNRAKGKGCPFCSGRRRAEKE